MKVVEDRAFQPCSPAVETWAQLVLLGKGAEGLVLKPCMHATDIGRQNRPCTTGSVFHGADPSCRVLDEQTTTSNQAHEAQASLVKANVCPRQRYFWSPGVRVSTPSKVSPV